MVYSFLEIFKRIPLPYINPTQSIQAISDGGHLALRMCSFCILKYLPKFGFQASEFDNLLPRISDSDILIGIGDKAGTGNNGITLSVSPTIIVLLQRLLQKELISVACFSE